MSPVLPPLFGNLKHGFNAALKILIRNIFFGGEGVDKKIFLMQVEKEKLFKIPSSLRVARRLEILFALIL
jgi:hypothetical protein